MRPQRNRYGVGLVPVLLLILWLVGLPTVAAAAQGSLELRCTVRRENKTVCLAGDEYALTLVAAAQETQTGLQYQTLPAYAFADCDWANCSSSQLREKARQLAPVARKRADYAAIQKTDTNGVAVFPDVTPGLYLVLRTKTAPENTPYTFEPFLAGIPTVVNGTAVYQVVAEPKYGWDTPSPEPTVPPSTPNPSFPQTGQLWWPLPVMIGLAIALMVAALACRKRSPLKKRDREALLVSLSILLMAASFGLYTYNVMDSNRAGAAAQTVVNQLHSDMPAAGNTESETASTPEPMPEPYKAMQTKMVNGQPYIGTLQIPALSLELPVIAEWSYPALRIAPCRYMGSVYQDNMILCAHNYSTHFGRLTELKVGDEAVFSDMEGNAYTYRMTAQEILPGTDPEAMEKGEWDLTLFTCTLGGKNRVTIRFARTE